MWLGCNRFGRSTPHTTSRYHPPDIEREKIVISHTQTKSMFFFFASSTRMVTYLHDVDNTACRKRNLSFVLSFVIVQRLDLKSKKVRKTFQTKRSGVTWKMSPVDEGASISGGLSQVVSPDVSL